MKGMTVIVKKTTQLIAGMVFLYGIYVIIHGHLTPGGGFAGGVVLAGSFILLILAFGSDFVNLTKEESGSTMYENLAILVVILLAVSGLLMRSKGLFSQLAAERKCRGTRQRRESCRSTIFLSGLKWHLQFLQSFLHL